MKSSKIFLDEFEKEFGENFLLADAANKKTNCQIFLCVADYNRYIKCYDRFDQLRIEGLDKANKEFEKLAPITQFAEHITYLNARIMFYKNCIKELTRQIIYLNLRIPFEKNGAPIFRAEQTAVDSKAVSASVNASAAVEAGSAAAEAKPRKLQASKIQKEKGALTQHRTLGLSTGLFYRPIQKNPDAKAKGELDKMIQAAPLDKVHQVLFQNVLEDMKAEPTEAVIPTRTAAIAAAATATATATVTATVTVAAANTAAATATVTVTTAAAGAAGQTPVSPGSTPAALFTTHKRKKPDENTQIDSDQKAVAAAAAGGGGDVPTDEKQNKSPGKTTTPPPRERELDGEGPTKAARR